MLSKFVTSMALKQNAARSLRMTPLIFNRAMVSVPQRMFLDRLGLENSTELVVDPKNPNQGTVALWQDRAKAQENALVLKDNDQIEKYVISIVKNYFRTTKKAKVTLESQFTEHGLDSLDVIELIIQIEDELGYVIDAENLTKFKKPKHFVNFITQMEAYKSEFHRLPHEGIHADLSLRAAFPGLPGEKKKKAAH
jgi:acyl carrier protein